MAWKQVGYPESHKVPATADFYVLSNEDIGFIADLVVGTSDTYSFALPYPSYIELDEDTMVVHAIEFMHNQANRCKTTLVPEGLLVYLSFLDKEFPGNFVGVLSDGTDEEMKAQGWGPFYFGDYKYTSVSTAALEGDRNNEEALLHIQFRPHQGLDCFTPLYIQFVNQAATITLTSSAVAAKDFTKWEGVTLRVWFTERKLTASEKDMRKAFKYLIMDA